MSRNVPLGWKEDTNESKIDVGIAGTDRRLIIYILCVNDIE